MSGETAETFALKEAFLQRIFAAGLMVRHVNLRQLMPFEGTRTYANNTLGPHDKLFHLFKECVRETFDVPMLERVFPVGTVLRDVIIEVSGAVSFGRQMGTDPILCGFPIQIPAGSVMAAAVVSYGQRSVTVLPVPIEINRLNAAAKIAAKKPYPDGAAFHSVVSAAAVEPLISLMRF